MKIWNKKKLSEVADVIGGGTPSTNNFEYWEGDIPWITPKDLSGYNKRYISKGSRNISMLGLKNSSSRILPKGSVLLTSRAPIGYIAIAKNEVCTNQGFKSLVLKEGNDSQFFYYLLKNNIEYIKNMSSGSTFSEISGTQVKNLEFEIPPLETQRKIAKVLSAFDDKIELNNKINENLEQQAQAIFKSWFIDFEPFGGKMPNDWSLVPLKNIADFIGGYSYKGNELQNSNCAMATIKNFGRNGGFKLDGFKEIIPTNIKSEQEVKIFDIVVAHTDLTQNADVIGNAEILLSCGKYEKIIFSMDLVKVLPKQKNLHFILATMLKNKNFKNHCLGYINGTTVLHLSKKALPDYIINIPKDLNTLLPLEELLKNIYVLIANNLNENIKLTNLRDTLLPKLMSGELKV